MCDSCKYEEGMLCC